MTNFNGSGPCAVRRAHFIERAKALWGDAYDYSDLQFTTGKEPCFIRCPKHGVFRVGAAQNHILKNPRFRTGCPYCREAMGKTDRRLASERKAKRDAEKKKRAVERRIQAEQRKRQREEQRILSGKKTLLEVREYLALLGYDVEGLSQQKIASIYGSLKAKTYNDAQHAKKQANEAEKKKGVERMLKERKQRIKDKYLAGAKAVHGDKYDYSEAYCVSEPNPVEKAYVIHNIICPIHGSFSQKAEVHVVQRCGCPRCANYQNNIAPEERKSQWVTKCREKFGDRFDYSQFHYVNNDTKGTIICREHKYPFETDPCTHLRGAGSCPLCSGSVGEVKVRKWLDDHHVAYQPQFRIPNINPKCKRRHLFVDFYLPDHGTVIEFNGAQHYTYIPYFHNNGNWTLKDQQIRDETLREYCDKKHLLLVEIKEEDMNNIPKIMKSAIKPCRKRA